MKEERITIELTSKSMMDLQNIGLNAVVDLEHIPFTDFTLSLPRVKNEEEISLESLEQMYEKYCLQMNKSNIFKNNKDKKEFFKSLKHDMENTSLILDISVKDREIVIVDKGSWSLVIGFNKDVINCKEMLKNQDNFTNTLINWDFKAETDTIEKIANTDEEFMKSLTFNIFLVLGIISFLQSKKKEVVKTRTRLEVKNPNKKGKSKKKTTYIYNKTYIFEDKTVSEDDIKDTTRTYQRHLESWTRRGHWRHYKNGKKKWIDKTTIHAKDSVTDPQRQSYKITKVN